MKRQHSQTLSSHFASLYSKVQTLPSYYKFFTPSRPYGLNLGYVFSFSHLFIIIIIIIIYYFFSLSLIIYVKSTVKIK